MNPLFKTTLVVLLFAALAELSVAQTANPDPQEVIFEGKPLRKWLLAVYGAGDSVEDFLDAEDALPRFCVTSKQAVPALAAAAADKDILVRRAAVRCLSLYLDKDAREAAIPVFLKTLQEEKENEIRRLAVDGLGNCGRPQDKAVLAALHKARKDEDANIRATAIGAFGNLKPAAVLPIFTEALRDHEVVVRCQAVIALGKLGQPKIVIPLLIDALSDDEAVESGYALTKINVRDCASRVLSELCPEAIPALCKALQHPNREVRAAALFAFHVTAKNVWPLLRKETPTLVALLDDEDEHIRWRTIAILGQIKAADAVPALVAKLNDTDAALRDQCIDALGKIGPDAAVAVEKLIDRLLKDPEPRLRSTAAEALGRIGPKAKAAVPALIEALKDKSDSGKLALLAAEALGKIGPDAQAAVPALAAKLDDGNWEVRVESVRALNRIGPDAAAAVDKLILKQAYPPMPGGRLS